MDTYRIVTIGGQRLTKTCGLAEALHDFSWYPEAEFLEDTPGNLIAGDYGDWMRKYHPRIGTPR